MTLLLRAGFRNRSGLVISRDPRLFLQLSAPPALAASARTFASIAQSNYKAQRKMGKNKKSSTPPEDHLSLSLHHERAATPLIDTHTHLASTFAAYRGKYKSGRFNTVFELVRGLYSGHNIEAIVDVWCEAPVQQIWKEIADSALSEAARRDTWGGIDYWFVMGTILFHLCC